MKNFKGLLLGLLAVLVLSFFSSKAYAGAQDFTLVNYSGRTITNVYISPSDRSKWGPDVLKNPSLLYHGQNTEFTFSNYSERYFDIKYCFSNGESWISNGVDLGRVYKITVMGNGNAVYSYIDY